MFSHQISLKASRGCKQGLEGVRSGRPHQSRLGRLRLHPACRDALLVGLPGSSTPSSTSPITTSILLLLWAQSLRKRLPQSNAETLTPVQRMHSAHETLHSTNGYKCVFKEIPGLWNKLHSHPLNVHMCTHLGVTTMSTIAQSAGGNFEFGDFKVIYTDVCILF